MLSLYFFGAVAKLEGLRPLRISLNVVAPGFVDTPAAAAYILSEPDPRAAAERIVPLRGALPGRSEQMAGVLAWCVSPENSLMTRQIMSIDGGVERMARGENAW
jgi:NAD(P)-dependent dehydrogenase (short-subunit alcohol dehydrogenase family)